MSPISVILPERANAAMLSYLKNLRNERDSLSATSTAILEKAATEERQISDTERQSIDKMAERCAAIDEELTTFSAQYESQRKYAELRSALEGAEDKPDGSERKSIESRSAPKSWGEIFTESAEFRAYQGAGSSGRVTLPGLFTRAPITSGGIGGLPVLPQTVNIPQPAITTPLLDAVGKIGTNSQVVQWLVQNAVYPKAQVVPEGQPKPEAQFTLDTETGTLETLAHWKGITRQALANLPLIQSIVTDQLNGGIYAKLEADIASALAAAAIADVPTVAGDSLLPGIRAGIATVQSQGFPNAKSVLLNPNDWSSLDLAVFDATNAGPTRQTGFWGLAPVASAAVPEGTAYVGDLKQGVTVFEQGNTQVYMTDSHADYFISNILVILAEVMALTMVTAPLALARVTVTAAP
jgi:HK97 family phage major capsid protein